MTVGSDKTSKGGVLRLIAIFKFFKAATLIALGIAALKLFHHDRNATLDHWASLFGLNPGGRYLDRGITKVLSLPPNRLKDVGFGSFAYAALFLTEGTGLWLMKPWAEWFTTIITASLVPLEVYEIVRHPTAGKVVVLAINIAVVVYLVLRIRKERSKN
jgi:uncharacterized membrane protein (DUF2068 family)